MDIPALQRAANEARGLAMDAIHKAASGHLGLPLGCAEIAAVLFGHGALRFHPHHPKWLNRDRFVLSAGHGSMLLYGWLHLAGYDLTVEDLRRFRQLHSRTPGHPEFGMTHGVEATTGPLGQGTANAVGYAASLKMLAAKFNTTEHKIFDAHVVCLCGDGCIQEGISAEAAAFAGRFGLDNLILLYDANGITLDAPASKTQSEDTAARYQSYGWEVQEVKDGNDLVAIHQAIEAAKHGSGNGKPKLVIIRTEAGRGIKEVQGTYKAHGEAGAPFIDAARPLLGLPGDKKFFVSEDTKEYFRRRVAAQDEEKAAWDRLFAAWERANPEKAALLRAGESHDHGSESSLSAAIPEFPADAKPIATRASGEVVLNHVAKASPLFLSGSADLHGSTKNYIKGGGDFDKGQYDGRNFYFGIREHAMGAILNGIAYDGIFKPSGATFLVFSDYMRPAVRLAALSKLPVVYIWTHDSPAVGEDGPTHQPVETLSALRAIPNLDVVRPADSEETAAAFVAAVTRADGPTALILTRQNVPTLPLPAAEKRGGVLRGGYVVHRETGALRTILLATGSEVSVALEAARRTDPATTRVVSLPSFERFERQPADYRESVLPAAVRRRVAVEAAVAQSWFRYVGLDGRVVGPQGFGVSAPGNVALEELGISVAGVVKAIEALA